MWIGIKNNGKIELVNLNRFKKVITEETPKYKIIGVKEDGFEVIFESDREDVFKITWDDVVAQVLRTRVQIMPIPIPSGSAPVDEKLPPNFKI